MGRRQVVAGIVAGALIATGLAGLGASGASAAGLNATLVWTRTFPGTTFLQSSPTPAKLTTSAYVVGGLDGKVYAFDAATGANEPGWPVQTTSPVNSSPAVADVEGIGKDQVFVSSGQAQTTVAAFCSGGGTYAIEWTGAVRWHNTGSDPDCAQEPFQASIAIGDTTANGQPSATAGSLGLNDWSWNASSGVLESGWPYYSDDSEFSTPALVSLTGGVGPLDIVSGGDATAGAGSFRGGMMRAMTGAGKVIWQYDLDEQVASSPAIGNLDGGLSVVFGTGNYWQLHGGATDSDSLFVLNASGQLKWRKDLGGVTMGSPALASMDNNGSVDIIEGTVGAPGNANGGLVWVLDGSGNPLPGWGGVSVPGGVVIGGISTADLNGDGVQDLLVPTGAGVYIYDGKTASVMATLDTGRVAFQSTPLVTNDGGGSVGITVAGTEPNGTGVVQHWRVAGATVGSWPMFHHDAQHTGVLAGTVAAPTVCVPASASVAPTGKVARVAGTDRDATAVAVSKASYGALGAKAVVLASNANYPDALAGGPLAAARGGPLLITSPGALDPEVKAEIQRVLAPLGTVYVLGGTAALSPSIDSALKNLGYSVQRVAGSDRYATAVAIAGQMGSPSTVFEVTGSGFADALAAGPAAVANGGAILLTAGSKQASATAAYVSAHPGARYAVGGPAAAADPSAVAVSGADRYATAVAVATRWFGSASTVGFATGSGFADALTGGPAMGKAGGPLLLVPGCGKLPASVTGYLSTVQSLVGGGMLFGGSSAVGDDVLSQLDASLA